MGHDVSLCIAAKVILSEAHTCTHTTTYTIHTIHLVLGSFVGLPLTKRADGVSRLVRVAPAGGG